MAALAALGRRLRALGRGARGVQVPQGDGFGGLRGSLGGLEGAGTGAGLGGSCEG